MGCGTIKKLQNVGLLTACEQDQDGTAVPSWSCSQAVSKPVWHIPLLCVQWKTPDDGQRNCPKHVGFYSKNKFVKLVHLVGFIIRIYHDARSPERLMALSIDLWGCGSSLSHFCDICVSEQFLTSETRQVTQVVAGCLLNTCILTGWRPNEHVTL
jgi:hypothetical protein